MLTNPQGLNDVTSAIIGAAIEVHKATGPGLLEAAYGECMAIELKSRGLEVESGVKIAHIPRSDAVDSITWTFE